MNLLTDPLFRVETNRGPTKLTLPGLLAALGRDEIEHLIGIQRHQEDAFHVFLCNLSAVILARRNTTNPVQSEDFWRQGLRDLAKDAGDDAWTLVVKDMSKPAFMQPPLPSAEHSKLKPVEPFPNSPDALDLLQTAKNHDVKRARAMTTVPDTWIYSLVSLQTMSGFLGRGNPGISRMNSGFGNRSVVELVRTFRMGNRWQDAVIRLLEYRQDVLHGPYGYDANGLVLVWLEPWDGTDSIPLSKLDPFYIEICRRVRLTMQDGALHAASLPSSAFRIAATQLRGVVGDAWLPVDESDSGGRSGQIKALTVSPQGLTVDLLRRLVFNDQLTTTPLQKPHSSWKEPIWLKASVLVRGQGTTDGFYERTVSIPPRQVPRLFGPRKERDPLAQLAASGIEYASKMQRSVLRPAVFAYLQGAPDTLQFDGESVRWWPKVAQRFESLWADEYFPWLWSVPEHFDEDEMLYKWALRLRDFAFSVLQEVHSTMPSRTGRRWRSRSGSERRFFGALYGASNFPQLKEVDYERAVNS